MEDRLKRPLQATLSPLMFAVLGTLVGVAVGAVGGIFGKGIECLSAFGMAHFKVYVWLLPAVGVLTVAMLKNLGGGGLGMRAVFRASRGERKGFELRSVFFQFAGTWGAHLFCASVGREGAGIQIGAAIGGNIGKHVPVPGADRILLIAGMAAGFSALFGTPLCALFFALEVTIVGGIRLRALIPAAFASYSAWYTAGLCGLAHFAPSVAFSPALDLSLLARLFALGALCGLAGLFFCLARKHLARFFAAAVPNGYVRAAAAGLLLAALLYLTGGRYSGLGTNLISFAVEGGQVYAYDWVVKLLFTAAFLSVGFLGGEVTTLFAAGACLGAAFSGLFGLPAEVAACLGYAALFGGATNTVFAPVLLCCEIFGGGMLPYAAIACIAAYLFNFGHSVYDQRVREDIVAHVVKKIAKKNKLPRLPKPLY